MDPFDKVNESGKKLNSSRFKLVDTELKSGIGLVKDRHETKKVSNKCKRRKMRAIPEIINVL